MGRSALQFIDIPCVYLQVAPPSSDGGPPVRDVHHLVRIWVPKGLGCGLALSHHDLVPNLNLLVFGFLPLVEVLVYLLGHLVLAVGIDGRLVLWNRFMSIL